jgi:hypothetical protein
VFECGFDLREAVELTELLIRATSILRVLRVQRQLTSS